MPRPIDVSRTGYALDVKRYVALAEKGHTIRVLNDNGSLHMIMSIPQERLECCDAAKQLAALRDAAAALIAALPRCTESEEDCNRPATWYWADDGVFLLDRCDEHGSSDEPREEDATAAPLRALQAVLGAALEPSGKGTIARTPQDEGRRQNIAVASQYTAGDGCRGTTDDDEGKRDE